MYHPSAEIVFGSTGGKANPITFGTVFPVNRQDVPLEFVDSSQKGAWEGMSFRGKET